MQRTGLSSGRCAGVLSGPLLLHNGLQMHQQVHLIIDFKLFIDVGDVGADGMYYNAGRKGSIETMPDTPGLAVWKSGHIGVYIGSGEVIEAMDTRYGVVKTKLQGRGWSHWLEVPGIKYD